MEAIAADEAENSRRGEMVSLGNFTGRGDASCLLKDVTAMLEGMENDARDNGRCLCISGLNVR